MRWIVPVLMAALGAVLLAWGTWGEGVLSESGTVRALVVLAGLIYPVPLVTVLLTRPR